MEEMEGQGRQWMAACMYSPAWGDLENQPERARRPIRGSGELLVVTGGIGYYSTVQLLAACGTEEC